MKKIVFTILVMIPIVINAQNTITGTITDDSDDLPLIYADVILENYKSGEIRGTSTDEDGEFRINIPKDKYIFTVRYVGDVLYKDTLRFFGNTSIGEIKVKSYSQLDEISIMGEKKLIDRKIDRLVFNVENSSKSSQGDAMELLKVTPGIRVRNNQITMIGKSDLGVMIDDKLIRLSGRDLTNLLKSLASEDIKSIEVITTPPANYEASGNSGIINITLKNARSDSWNALLKSSFTQRRYSSGAFSGNFTYNKNKLSLTSAVYYRKGTFIQDFLDETYFPDALWRAQSTLKANVTGINARLSANYSIADWWDMGVQIMYNQSEDNLNENPVTVINDYSGGEEGRILSNSGMKIKPEINSINYYNELKLDTLGNNVMVNLDYFSYQNPDNKIYDGIYSMGDFTQFFRGVNQNDQNVENFSSKVDVDIPLKWLKLVAGGKVSFSESTNDINFFNSGLQENEVNSIDLSANDFKYEENIYAAYLSAKKDIGAKVSIQAGLRLESTRTQSSSDNLGFNNSFDYTKLFPSVYLGYNSSENSIFSLSYNRRIARPPFNILNPNLYYTNPFQIIQGNPFLQPAFINNFEFSHTYKNLVSTLYYSKEDNMFSQIPVPNPETNITRFLTENYVNTKKFGLSENYTFNPYEWWTSNNSFDINFSNSSFDPVDSIVTEDVKGFNSTVSTNNDFVLSENEDLLLGLNFWYQFPGVNGIFKTESLSSLSLSFQYLLLNDNLNISLHANDIFKGQIDRTTATVNNVYQKARYYYDSRSFQFSISYKFGNKEIRSKKTESSNSDELNRL